MQAQKILQKLRQKTLEQMLKQTLLMQQKLTLQKRKRLKLQLERREEDEHRRNNPETIHYLISHCQKEGEDEEEVENDDAETNQTKSFKKYF